MRHSHADNQSHASGMQSELHGVLTMTTIVQSGAPAPVLQDLHQTAAFINFSFSAVRHWTYGSKPAPAGWPSPVKVGNKSIRYRTADLLNWIDGLSAVHLRRDPPDQQVKRRPGRPRKLEVSHG